MLGKLLVYLYWKQGKTRAHWRAGVHSEIPYCCIVWYFIRSSSGWPWLLSNNPFLIKIWWWLFESENPLRNYVRCPSCWIRRKYIVLHICGEQCIGVAGGFVSRKEYEDTMALEESYSNAKEA